MQPAPDDIITDGDGSAFIECAHIIPEGIFFNLESKTGGNDKVGGHILSCRGRQVTLRRSVGVFCFHIGRPQAVPIRHQELQWAKGSFPD